MCYNSVMEQVTYKNKKVFVSRDSQGTLGKECSSCGLFKEYTEYCIRFVDGRNYLFALCNSCKNASLKKRRHSNIQERLYHSCKHRATRQSLPFNLALEDIVVPVVCPILGLILDPRGGKRSDLTPTVDRINPLKGYTKDNIVVCSWRANKLKSDATITELDLIHQFILNHTRVKAASCPDP